MRAILKDCTKIIRENKRAYMIINVAYYGLIILASIYSIYNPSLKLMLKESATQALTSGPLTPVANAYLSGNFFIAAAVTFAVNTILGSFLYITLPSMIIPFLGLLTGAFRAVLWGLFIFSPVPFRAYDVPAWLVMILEGQGYIVAMLAAYIQGKAFIWPESVVAKTRLQSYAAGLRATWKLYILVLLILAVAAAWEAFEVIYIAPMIGSPSLNERLQL